MWRGVAQKKGQEGDCSSVPLKPRFTLSLPPFYLLQHLISSPFFYSLSYRGSSVFLGVPTTYYRLVVTSTFLDSGSNIEQKENRAHSSQQQPFFFRMVPCSEFREREHLCGLTPYKARQRDPHMEPVSLDILERRLSFAQVDERNDVGPGNHVLGNSLLAQTTSHRTLRERAQFRRGWKAQQAERILCDENANCFPCNRQSPL